MNLIQFLETASSNHEEALSEARAYVPAPYLWRIEGPIRKTQVETALIIHHTENRLVALIETPDTPEPVLNLAKTVLRSLVKLYEPEFYINLADPEVALLFDAAIAHGILNSDESSRIIAAATYTTNPPFANIPLHSILVARDVCPTISIDSDIGGYIVIHNSIECELHSPNLWATNNRTLKKDCVGRFPLISNVGRYELKKPSGNYSNFEVDNAYGSISAINNL